jgi:glutamate racemase
MIEEQFVHNNISQDIIATYLSDQELVNIDTLILGCTHYPIIKAEIENYYGGTVNVIDSAQMVSSALKTYIEEKNIVNTETPIKDKFLVSDYTEAFEKAAQFFFGDEIQLEKYPLWE